MYSRRTKGEHRSNIKHKIVNARINEIEEKWPANQIKIQKMNEDNILYKDIELMIHPW